MIGDFREGQHYDQLPCLLVLVDRQQNIGFINRLGLELLRYTRAAEIVGRPFSSLFVPGTPTNAAAIDALTDGLPTESRAAQAAELLCADGSLLPVRWTLCCRDAHGAPLPQALWVAQPDPPASAESVPVSLFQKVADFYSGSLVITLPDMSIVYANPAVLRMTGYSAAEVLGQKPSLFKSGQTATEVYASLWNTVNAGGIWTGELINRRKDGEHFLESKTISAIRDEQGCVQYYFAIGEDLSQRMKYQQWIEALRYVDELTGLPNRHGFLNALTGTLDLARQDGKAVSLLHIDIDDFAVISEHLGAQSADAALNQIAQGIKNALRQGDRLAYLGNERFAALIGPHTGDTEKEIGEVCERVMAAVRKTTLGGEEKIHGTVSIGAASSPRDGDDASDLMSHALVAVEHARSGGGNRYTRFDARTLDTVSERRRLLSELQHAIEHDQLVLHYQPQASLFSGALVGLETLVRWQHPTRGLIFPGEFIPLAENTQQIVDLGEWVLREVCRQQREWQDRGLPVVKVAVNLAARHFLVHDLDRRIGELLAAHSIDPVLLEIEITETAVMQDIAGAIRNTTRLKSLGVSVSLDDFGTGYSSLAYLSRFPIDVVKIDQSFVRDITINPANAAIAQATIAMSHKLGKTVLAEGVETEEQMHYLRRNECDEMQGYLFSRPLPAEDLMNWLNSGVHGRLSVHDNPAEQSTVLFVDDETNVLAALRRTLRREGYSILTAENASEAFSMLAMHHVQVVVSDQRMPGMSGTEFLTRVKTLYPETVRMVLSGYSEISSVTDAINKGAAYRFLLKPWSDEHLKTEILGALRFWRESYGPQKNAD